MNKQEFYRQEYKRANRDWNDSVSIYRDCVENYTQADTRILDVGCGHVDLMRSIYSRTPYVYGIEPNKYTLRRNITIENRVVAIAENIPFPDNFFDLTVSLWVLEHIDNPTVVFREIRRVLKPGGRLIFLTPNAWNYVTWINRAVPNNLHGFLARKLYSRVEDDTYPVRYRINSMGAMNSVLLPLGFEEIQMIFNGDPSYISFNRYLFSITTQGWQRSALGRGE